MNAEELIAKQRIDKLVVEVDKLTKRVEACERVFFDQKSIRTEEVTNAPIVIGMVEQPTPLSTLRDAYVRDAFFSIFLDERYRYDDTASTLVVATEPLRTQDRVTPRN